MNKEYIKTSLLLFLVFWNVENYFYPFPLETDSDTEYTVQGSKHWTFTRFKQKSNKLAKIIISLSGRIDCFPDIISFAEVENREVLKYLTTKTLLQPLEYVAVHKNSPDSRGSDVAMLYNPKKVKLLKATFHPITTNKGDTIKTREILHSKIVIIEYPKDTLHIFVNHWPSKRGGAKVSETKRNTAASNLNKLIDSIKRNNPEHIILACGDFNTSNPKVNIIYNKPKLYFPNMQVNGTYKFKKKWETIDHSFVHIPLNKTTELKYNIEIYNHKYLLVPDKKYTGVKPLRTYSGPVYQGGASDHLPLITTIYKTEKN